MRELWPHQAEALTALRQSIAGGVRRIILQAPCGSGKTLLAAAIADGALKKNKRLAFVVSQISLIDQTVQSFYSEGVREIGVLQGDHAMVDWSKPIQVCSVQTLQSRKALPEAAIVVIDEAHILHKFHKNWMTMPEWQAVPFIGLTATPGTKGLGKYFQTMLIATTTKEMIAKGFLSQYRCFATGHPDLSGVKIVAGDYQENQLSDAMQKGTLTADIIQTWQERWGKDKTFVFAVDLAHAKALQARFLESGISCAYQDANTSPAERGIIKRKFHSGEYRVIANVGTLTIGVDYDVRCLILARPTRSEMLYCQIIGRALRTAPGKDFALLLDHSDSTERLGFIEDIYFDRLHDGKKESAVTERKTPLPKPCPKCACMIPRRNGVCPNCGFEVKRVNGFVEQDGELVEITGGVKSKKGKKSDWSMERKAKFLAELKAYGLQHGRKPGWSSWSYKEKTGSWPDWSIRDVPPAEYPSAETVSWVKSRNIAFAKSQRRKRAADAVTAPAEPGQG